VSKKSAKQQRTSAARNNAPLLIGAAIVLVIGIVGAVLLSQRTANST